MFNTDDNFVDYEYCCLESQTPDQIDSDISFDFGVNTKAVKPVRLKKRVKKSSKIHQKPDQDLLIKTAQKNMSDSADLFLESVVDYIKAHHPNARFAPLGSPSGLSLVNLLKILGTAIDELENFKPIF